MAVACLAAPVQAQESAPSGLSGPFEAGLGLDPPEGAAPGDSAQPASTGSRKVPGPAPRRLLPTGVRRQLRSRLERLGAADLAERADPVGALKVGLQLELWREWATKGESRPLALAVIGLLVLLLVLGRRARRPGDLVVLIDYPQELRGTFSVEVVRRRPRSRRSRRARASRRDNASTATEHHMVARETQFRGLRPGRYWVQVEGELVDTVSDSAVCEPLEVQAVQVRPSQTVRLEFGFQPRGCPLEVHVLWEGRPAREAMVAVGGRPDTLRYVRGGGVRLELEPGRHRIFVGGKDRVGELEVDVGGYRTRELSIDLAGIGKSSDEESDSDAPHDAVQVVFKGCPSAVEPYMQGYLRIAARALAGEGQREVAQLLQARLSREAGALDKAAEHFEAAGRPLEAAEAYLAGSDFARAALLLEVAGEPQRAAEAWESAGDPAAAGEAWESAREFERAVVCYREAGDPKRLAGALERKGALLEAARVAEPNDPRRSIRLLRGVAGSDAEYAQASDLLVDLLEAEGQPAEAAEKLEECIGLAAPDRAAPALYDRLSRLLAESGDAERALEVLEALRAAEPDYPELRTRVEELRKQIALDDPSFVRTPHPDRTSMLGSPSNPRYEMVERIGQGGMGVVFKARDRRLGREVALKRLPDDLREDPHKLQLFFREARAAAALNHPNIVTLFDADEEDGHFFITMELLEGHTLSEVLRHEGPLSAENTAWVGLQVATGLAYAHEQRIIHRDIKPSNLFVTRERIIKIMDFGLAKVLEEVMRSVTIVGGTPYYMAPEQATGEPVDARTDLYALGVTLFQSITDSVPFEGADVAYQHRHEPAPDPRTRCPDVPDALAELILAMLEKRPADRPSSAEEVSRQLVPFAPRD